MYTSKRRSFWNFWRNKNTKYYIAFFLLFVAVMAVMIITIKKNHKSSNSTNKGTVSSGNQQTVEFESATIIKSGTYNIIINLANYQIIVYENDSDSKPVRVMPAAISSEIKIGKYTPNEVTATRTTWKEAEEDYYYRYFTNLGNEISFHSARYTEKLNKASLLVSDYDSIGSTNNDGSIMLCIEDAKWIFEHCSTDSTIEVISDESINYSDALRDLISIPNGIKWDPTDTSSGTPWCLTELKSLDCPNSLEFTAGISISDIRKNIAAYDISDEDVTAYVMIDGSYNLDKAGEYTIILQIADMYGNFLQKNVIIKISEPEINTESETVTESETDTEPETDTTPENETQSEETPSETAEPESESQAETTSEEPETTTEASAETSEDA